MCTSNCQNKEFPFILSHAIAVHKSQGSTLNYMKSDLSPSTGKKTITGKTYQQPISQGQFDTLLSRAKSRDKFLLLNFDPEQIKVNESALEEMVWMRQPVFSWQHPLKSLSTNLSTKHKGMECSFRTLSQWRHLTELF